MDTPPPPPPVELESSLRNLTILIYVLYALSFFAGITLLIGVVVAYVKRPDTVRTIYYSHLSYLIRTFWWTLALSIIGALTLFIGIGAIILLGVYVYLVVRLVIGFVKLWDRRTV
ncbi:DUF4870 family protein [Oceanidesulfovibrio marinus]|uniref:Transmembrane protein n=1 Tax=Oceanidesulfovibrio marinus TaxID=370038 RepID=A0A6P1ZFJ0_9BACT|nr:hypothetical protein [Oceanidesulfovibrio marinus]QJT09358.1 hypothetical protein E8L03_10580 [Oceanidesulfovibrio marinus]TVM32850.1 hypothetical protein DQK91_14180 [Oceanidesulfovibrio marinus]